MAVTDVLRPVSVRKNGGGTSVPSGTLSAVTSDNNDATYIDENLGTNPWNLRVGSHTPTTHYQRHRVRGRIRIRTDVGTATEDIDLGRGTTDYIEYDTVPVTASFAEQAGSWYSDAAYGLSTVGALTDLNIGGGYMDSALGGAGELRTAECYVDVDCRFWPDYSPQIRDNAGVDQTSGTVTDTNQPDLYFGAIGYDGLPALDWTVTVYDAFAVAQFSSSGSGTPPGTVPTTVGLPDGAYTAVFRVRSTIRGADPFEHETTLAFAIENIVPPPSPPLISVTHVDGGYLVEWEDPGGQAWDNDYVVAEVWRQDCTGNQRIATVPDGLNGSYFDLAIPQLDPQPVPGPDCVSEAEPCEITYSVRYLGYVSTFVELPDTIPAQMILGWPSTVGSIPSGWSRVTALDGYHPRGATTTGAPVITGGAASHSHTTAAHTHLLAAHSHTVGGSTGTSNASTTSARFNGASQPQADQPHSHTRPSATGNMTAFHLEDAAPGTSVVNNVPPTRDVIWLKSDGAQANYATGLLGWATEAVSGWVDDASSLGRFLKGAVAAGNGGAQTGASTHTHTVNAHVHGGGTPHNHSISATGLSNPSSSVEAGFGSTPPRWLPRHTHPLDVIPASAADTTSGSGGATDAATLEPPNRRLRVLRNTGGGTQTRVIGLYTGTVAALDPLLTLCNGSGGTPDMRTLFARDLGADSVNSTGGSTNHSHTTAAHTHTSPTHSHAVDVLTSTTGSFEAPSTGDLGSSPTTGHDHSSAASGGTSAPLSSDTSGTTSTVDHIPTYKEVHFVRLDGTISGGPLPVPELRISDFSSTTVQAFTYSDGLDRIANLTDQMAIVTSRNMAYPRLVTDSTPMDGGLHTVSTTLAGEDLALSIAVEGRAAIDELETLLSADRVYFSPLGGTPGWYAPQGWIVRAPVANVKVLSLTLVKQPWPTTADPGDYL